MPFKVKADSKSLAEDATYTGNVLSNDTSATGVSQAKFGSGSFTPVASGGTTLTGTYGILTISPDGSYTYVATTPQAEALAAGTTASDVFTYTATSSSGATASTTLTLAVTGINDAPVLTGTTTTLNPITEDDTTNGGQTVSSFLSSTDVDSGAKSGIAINGLSSGNGTWQYSLDGGAHWSAVGAVSSSSSLLLDSSNLIRFVPNGIDGTSASFTYRAWDESSGTVGTKASSSSTGGATSYSSGVGTASLTVASINDNPVAANDSATTTKDTPVTINVLANDSDRDGGTLSITGVGTASHGTAVIQSGNVVYTPTSGYTGTDGFTYTISDGQGGTTVGNVSVSVNAPGNLPPVANPDSATTTRNTSVTVDVLANDSDPDGGTLSITGVGTASHGTPVIQSGKVVYTPASGYTGTDAFTYTVSDGQGGTTVGNVSVNVAPPTSASATSVTFRQGTAGYAGAVDTMLRAHYPSETYDQAFVVSPQGDSGYVTQGLLEFNNLFGAASGQIPVGATIVSATLSLMTTNPSADAGTINQMLVAWNASSTWNSLGSGVQVGTEASSTNAVAIGAASVGVHSYDVTSSVQSWAAAGSTSTAENSANKGWLFNLTGTDFWNFTSVDGDVKPVLSVTYAPAGSGSPAALPSVSISAPPASTPQMENGGKITFTVTLSQAASQDVIVNYSTADGTAKLGSDYVAGAGTLTFHAGETSKTFDVSLVNDTTAERVEAFTAQITSAINAKVATATADAHITDDDVTVAPMAPLNASIVASYDLSNGAIYKDDSGGTYGIGDPSGIAWIPSLNELFIADSEHDESPYFSNINLFALNSDGTYVRNYSLESFTNEDTGLGYDPNNGFLYISDDSKYKVFWVDPLNPSVALGSFDVRHLGYQDAEDLKIDPLTGHIHEIDGELMQMIELTTTGQFVDSVPLPAVMKDAEALAYDPRHDVYFVSSGHESNHNIYVMDPLGNLLSTISVLSSFSNVKVKGLELAPSSDPNDGNQLSLYVADYGSDQVNDGKLWEIHLGSDWIYT
jgi:VCBS repeat-containing protein